MSPPALAARHLDAGHGRTVVVDDLTLEVAPRTVTALVGPNGSGKSTLLMTLARVLRPQAGEVLLDGSPLARTSSVEVARRLGVLPQSAVVPTGATVREVVEQGRYPQLGAWAMLRRRDDTAMRRALELTGLTALADRRLDSLSGGERQRAWIAMTLAQETGILLLDEPTTYLDVRHQIDLMNLVEHLRDDHAMTVVMVLHDLNQAARHADRIVALRGGRVRADGPPRAVLTPTVLREVFDVDAVVVDDPVTGRPLFVSR
ncbi:iron-dicitrate ABC transporter ATP-binding protein [Nocardioides sp. OK12]|uniref:ABC transporter ATP-binding protein n=1 Tax=Nocardioides sp. OK12 TaxID=2758661 RepID=UPI0021C293C6|nr:ABC transporter ATP-binding protein [Nocardioides sp. OK12]GHJ59767.1 iron-dicitrate ABC transporter ATP-binding protein [Nocardioides sp. OK12]